MSDPFSVPPPAPEPDDNDAFDTGSPIGDPLLGGDEALVKEIGRRTSNTTRIFTILLVLGVIGGGAFAYMQSTKVANSMEVFDPIAEMTDEDEIKRALRGVLEESSYTNVRVRAIRNLGHYRDAEAVPLLVEALDDAGAVRRSAAWALSRVGSPSADVARPKLLEILPDTDEADQNQVVWTLCVLGENSDEVVALLLERFAGGQIQHVEGFDLRVVKDVIGLQRLTSSDLTANESQAIRELTAQALGEVHTAEVVRPLRSMLEAELAREPDAQSVEVIRASAAALGRAGADEAASALVEAMRQHRTLRGTLVSALRQSVAAPELSRLLAQTRADETEIRTLLLEIIADSHDERAADALASLTSDENLDIRETATLALARLGDRRAAAPLLALTRIEGDDHDTTISKAIEHLRFVASPEITDDLVELIERHPFRRAATLAALGRTGDPNAARALLRNLDTDDVKAAAVALATLGDDAAYRRLLADVPRGNAEMAARDAADRSLSNETLLAKRRAAIVAMGRFGHPEAVEALMGVVEDEEDDYELRALAAASIGQVATEEQFQTVLGRLTASDVSDASKRYYVQALWQKPHADLGRQMLALVENSSLSPEVRRSAAIAVGYAASSELDADLIRLLGDPEQGRLENPGDRRNAAVAIVLGGGDEAIAALMAVLANDGDTAELLAETVRSENNDFFNLLTEDMFERGSIWRRVRNGYLLREGDGENVYGYAWTKVLGVLEHGWNGVGGVGEREARAKFFDALMNDEEHRELAAAVLHDNRELGLLLRARDEGGAGGEAARSVMSVREAED